MAILSRRSAGPMSGADAEDLVKVYFQAWKANREAVSYVDRWYRGKLEEGDKPSLPKKHTREYKELRDRSMGQFLRLAVTSTAQGLFVEGLRSGPTTEGEDGEAAPADAMSPLWRVWQANRMDRRQIARHRGILSHAVAYTSIIPGKLDNGEPMPQWRIHSAREMICVWQDITLDEWPMYALGARPIKGADGSDHWRFQLYDDQAIYTVDSDAEGSSFTYITTDLHRAGLTPVVMYPNMLDLDGRLEGDVEPFIPLAARLDQDTMDRLVVQRFGAWVVRTISGMTRPDTDEEVRAEKMRLAIEDLLVSESPDTKFGGLPTTPLDGFIKAKEHDIYEFGAVTQTPPTDLVGQMINLSAEALAAAQDGKYRKVQERQHIIGEADEQAFRLSAHYLGDDAAANDYEMQVVWADTEVRSLAQVADAFGKLATMLGVPPQALWDRIPGVTQSDVERWKKMAEEGGGLEALMRELAAGQTSVEEV